ncbi:hypothetical protein [Streptomyces sp. NPDC018610]|uniref:hypothetical protein n=1 Tax=Streptomyces sp. NPDC018610 TaxID=3365049 RepID=UPI0037AEA85D
MSGLGRIGGRQVVAVLALGGGLLLGPLLPATAAEAGTQGPADSGTVPTTPDTLHDLAPPVLVPATGRPAGRTVGHGYGRR